MALDYEPRTLTEPGVHPVAALFPMLDDDELAALAEDIKAHGQVYPILRDADGQIIDGRNRQAACILAGVEPWYEPWTGGDPTAYILSANIERRHLTKSQRAMAIARAEDYAGVILRREDLARHAEDADTPLERISEARAVVRYCPDLAAHVMGGASLKAAYQRSLEVKREQADAEAERARRLKREAQQLKALQREAPALAAQVAAGTLTIAQAVAAAEATAQYAAEAPLREALLNEIALTREAIGDPVPLPEIPPDLSVRFLAEPIAVPGATAAALQDEKVCLQRLIETRKAVEALADTAPLATLSQRELHLNAVRSAAQQIIAAAYRLVERYEEALAPSTSLREVR